jgi:mono/diheme cytochrome c family protein
MIILLAIIAGYFILSPQSATQVSAAKPSPTTAKPPTATVASAAAPQPTVLAETTSLPAATVAPANTVAAAPPSDSVSFSQNVAPILTDHCLKCHGGERTKEGYDVNSYDKVMAGSNNGDMIVPGNSGKSEFIRLIKIGKMPPRKEPRLSPEQIRLLADWVDAGALNN